MARLGFSDSYYFTCGFFRELDDRGGYGYEDFAQVCATAPTGPLTGVWMSQMDEPRALFPRLYPVVLIDDGTDVFVRSLPGTERHLTMKLSFKYDYELSGPVAMHRPRPGSLRDPGADFHEHVRFRTPSRRYARLKKLDGEWQYRDMLAVEARAVRSSAAGPATVRPAAGRRERTGREVSLYRCTTSLDQAVLDEYIGVLTAQEPAGALAVPVYRRRAHGELAAPDPVMPLNEALSYLLYPGAGAAWHAAATQAARLLAPVWPELEDDEHAQERLGCLALTVYALADETIEAPAMVPFQELRNALRQAAKQIATSEDGEPQKLKDRISDALLTTGHGFARTEGTAERPKIEPLHQLYMDRSTPDWHVGQDRPYLPAGPSDMARLLPWLSSRMSRIDKIGLGPVPKPAGTLTVNVSGKVWTAESAGPVDTKTFVACPQCGPVHGATIIVDRTQVTLVCAKHHRSHPSELSAATVRLAVREARGHQETRVDPASTGPRTANIEGSLKLIHRVAYALKLPEQLINSADPAEPADTAESTESAE